MSKKDLFARERSSNHLWQQSLKLADRFEKISINERKEAEIAYAKKEVDEQENLVAIVKKELKHHSNDNREAFLAFSLKNLETAKRIYEDLIAKKHKEDLEEARSPSKKVAEEPEFQGNCVCKDCIFVKEQVGLEPVAGPSRKKAGEKDGETMCRSCRKPRKGKGKGKGKGKSSFEHAREQWRKACLDKLKLLNTLILEERKNNKDIQKRMLKRGLNEETMQEFKASKEKIARYEWESEKVAKDISNI